MTITVGDKLPQGKMLRVGVNGPEAVDSADLSRGRIALFGVPGAFTGTGLLHRQQALLPASHRTLKPYRHIQLCKRSRILTFEVTHLDPLFQLPL